MKKIILVGLVLVLLIGCNKTENKVKYCEIKDIPVYDSGLCGAIQEQRDEQYELGKLIGEKCDDEIRADIYKQAGEFYVERYSSDFKGNCLLVVTDGKEPQQNEWYTEMNESQFNPENAFPIRTWDLEKDQIEGYTGLSWNYWIICGD